MAVTGGKISPRIAWVVEMLQLQPADAVLEIGCGHGVAATIVAERLSGGTYLGLDRSVRMIAAAERRNQAHLESGRIRFVQANVEEWSPPTGAFDVAFAINVAILADGSSGAAEVVHCALKPGGRVHFCFQAPQRGTLAAIVAWARETFTQAGFTIEQTIQSSEEQGRVTCIVARK
jgi:ubiquinone/menaquinone biosynthesis C-methylase UbiE